VEEGSAGNGVSQWAVALLMITSTKFQPLHHRTTWLNNNLYIIHKLWNQLSHLSRLFTLSNKSTRPYNSRIHALHVFTCCCLVSSCLSTTQNVGWYANYEVIIYIFEAAVMFGGSNYHSSMVLRTNSPAKFDLLK